MSKACQLCGADDAVEVEALSPREETVALCATCRGQLGGAAPLDANHLRCLNESAWSPEPAVQVAAWRLLQKLAAEGETWAQDLLDMLYLEPEVLEWAEAGMEADEALTLKDAHGNLLRDGDTVMLIKDLDVKGAGFTAKRGTQVKNIRITDDGRHFEGKVNGTSIYIVAEYTKKV